MRHLIDPFTGIRDDGKRIGPVRKLVSAMISEVIVSYLISLSLSDPSSIICNFFFFIASTFFLYWRRERRQMRMRFLCKQCNVSWRLEDVAEKTWRLRVIIFLRYSSTSFSLVFCCVIETWTPHGWWVNQGRAWRVTAANRRCLALGAH